MGREVYDKLDLTVMPDPLMLLAPVGANNIDAEILDWISLHITLCAWHNPQEQLINQVQPSYDRHCHIALINHLRGAHGKLVRVQSTLQVFEISFRLGQINIIFLRPALMYSC